MATKCKFAQTCAFYQQAHHGKKPLNASLTNMYTHLVCSNNHLSCARYQVKRELGSDFVPPTLLPNEYDVADELIQLGKRMKQLQNVQAKEPIK
jgi:hypothetical protein